MSKKAASNGEQKAERLKKLQRQFRDAMTAAKTPQEKEVIEQRYREEVKRLPWTLDELWAEYEWLSKSNRDLAEKLTESLDAGSVEFFGRYADRRKSREAITRLKRQPAPETAARDDEIIRLRDVQRDDKGRRMKFAAIAARLGIKKKTAEVAYHERKKKLAQLAASEPPKETPESLAELESHWRSQREAFLRRYRNARQNEKR